MNNHGELIPRPPRVGFPLPPPKERGKRILGVDADKKCRHQLQTPSFSSRRETVGVAKEAILTFVKLVDLVDEDLELFLAPQVRGSAHLLAEV